MFKIEPTERNKRLVICKKCPFYHRFAGTCGTLILGDTVMHEGKEIKLCGCVMPAKTWLSFATCPANKW